MIEDLDASIKALLEYELADIHPNLSISFESPDNDFPSGVVTTPAVDLFLYDIRENLELRHNERFFHQSGPDAATTLTREAVLVECTYLITAWSDAVETAARDEQVIISDVIRALYRHVSIPDTLPDKTDPNGAPVRILQGGLAGADPLPRAFTIQTGHMQNPSEFWSAMGGKPKPQCNYQVTFAMDVFAPFPSELINRVNMDLREGRSS